MSKDKKPKKKKSWNKDAVRGGFMAAVVGLAGGVVGAGYLAVRRYEEKLRPKEEQQRKNRPPKKPNN